MSVNKLVSAMQTNKSRVIAGAVAAAAVAFPLYASLTTADSEVTAAPRCLAWFGNQADGHCLSYSNGSGVTVGSPNVGFGENGFGVYTGPLMPGTTISQGIGQWGN